MKTEELINQVSQNIKKSKKYKSVYDKTIYRIVTDFAIKTHSARELEKKSKNLLHQIWGAFYATRPNFKHILDVLEENTRKGVNVKENILPMLQKQSSVKERIPLISHFYQDIFAVTGMPMSLIDYACGLNPLTHFWMGLPEASSYQSFDIDEDQVSFLNAVFKLLHIKNASAQVGDILIDNSQKSDVALLLKLLPCLEHQKKGSGLLVMKNLPAKYLVVSYPVKSLSGKKAGMADFYRKDFKKLIATENWQVTELLFDSELVFVIKK